MTPQLYFQPELVWIGFQFGMWLWFALFGLRFTFRFMAWLFGGGSRTRSRDVD